MIDHTLASAESALLGSEFLTWLWFKGDNNHIFTRPNGSNFTMCLDGRVVVAGGEGEAKETTSVAGAHSDFADALSGLRAGKKVVKAVVRIDIDGEMWKAAVEASEFGLAGLRTPKVETRREEGEDPDGAVLEKLHLIETAAECFDAAFKEFLTSRLRPAAWEEEVLGLRRWMHA